MKQSIKEKYFKKELVIIYCLSLVIIYVFTMVYYGKKAHLREAINKLDQIQSEIIKTEAMDPGEVAEIYIDNLKKEEQELVETLKKLK